MTLVNTETGEIVEFDRAAAERRAERITMRLDAIAENYSRVLPMIREAVEKRDDIALGYRSPGDYVRDRFGQSLSGLGIDVRRAVVGELTEAGLSTRAIAPVVNVSVGTVHADQVFRTEHLPESPEQGRSEVPEPTAPVDMGDATAAAPAPVTPITGIDGKTYARTDAPKTPAPKRKPLTESADNAGWDLRKAVERLERIAEDDRLAANKEQMAPLLRNHLLYAVEVCQDLLARINS